MNMWKKINNTVIVEGKYYLTCIQQFGEITNVQKMKRVGNLWWTDDGMYVYYTPSHIKEVD